MRKTIVIINLFFLCLTACVSPRQMALFSTGASSVRVGEVPLYVIESGDILKIEFTSINKEAVAPYNSAGILYTVKDDGTIDVPIIGEIKMEGLNTEQAVDTLTKKVSDQVINPIVRLSITNAYITILGEVKSPSYLSAPQPITLPDALGKVGGLTQNARCKDVLVQRHVNGEVKQYHINLLTDELFTSPCYYLQKGDVVNIAPLHAK